MKDKVIPPNERWHKIKDNCPIPNWRFNQSTIDSMNSLVTATKRDGNEHGGALCGNRENNKIELEHLCVGDMCGIDLPEGCPKPTQVILGNFHTHPNTGPTDSANPSANDLNYHNAHKHLINCIGHPGSKQRKKEILCFTDRKDYPKTKEPKFFTDRIKDIELKERDTLIYRLMGEDEPEDYLETIPHNHPCWTCHIIKYKEIRKELKKYYKNFKPEECL